MVSRKKRLHEVFEHLRKFFGIHTQTDFAVALKYSRVYISSALNGNEKNLTDKLFENICEAYPGVFNLDYLLTGQGDLLTVEEDAHNDTIQITPDKWYYGLDYVTGDAVGQQRTERLITVPSSYIGTQGSLALSIFGLSGAQEWQTDVTVQARNASGGDLGTAVIHDAPFVRNRSTDYSGCLFSTGVNAELTLSTAWSDPHVGEF